MRSTLGVMGILWAASWGLLGGLCVELLELYAHIRHTQKWNWREPIRLGITLYLISVVCRVGVGAVLAAAAAGSGQVSGTLAAFGLGVAAPLVIEKLARAVPRTELVGAGAEHALASSAPPLAALHEPAAEPGGAADAR